MVDYVKSFGVGIGLVETLGYITCKGKKGGYGGGVGTEAVLVG